MTERYDTYGRVKVTEILSTGAIKIVVAFVVAIIPFLSPYIGPEVDVWMTDGLYFQGDAWQTGFLPGLEIEILRGEKIFAILWMTLVAFVFFASFVTSVKGVIVIDKIRDNNSPEKFEEMMEQVSKADEVESQRRSVFLFRWGLAALLLFVSIALFLVKEWVMGIAALVMGFIALLVALGTSMFSALDVARRAIDFAASRRDENKRQKVDR